MSNILKKSKVLDFGGRCSSNDAVIISNDNGDFIRWIDENYPFPYEDKTISIIFMNYTLHYNTYQITQLVNELDRILRIGGIIEIVDEEICTLYPNTNIKFIKEYHKIEEIVNQVHRDSSENVKLVKHFVSCQDYLNKNIGPFSQKNFDIIEMIEQKSSDIKSMAHKIFIRLKKYAQL